MKNKLFKRRHEDTIWWIDNSPTRGIWLFTFDREHIFNMFHDYPDKLTPEQVRIFDTENPLWAEFFADRKKGNYVKPDR